LVLTKSIGVGMVTTAAKREVATATQLRAAIAAMTTLNDAAARAAVAVGVRAGTDVTGFGLLGHLRTMMAASGVAAIVHADAVPTFEGVLDLARRDVVAGGTKRNHAWLNPRADWGTLTEPEQLVLADAQTSGGLLLATDTPEALLASLEERGAAGHVIGQVTEGPPGTIAVRGRVRE